MTESDEAIFRIMIHGQNEKAVNEILEQQKKLFSKYIVFVVPTKPNTNPNMNLGWFAMLYGYEKRGP